MKTEIFLEYFEYFCQISSKPILIIELYAVSKLVTACLRHCVEFISGAANGRSWRRQDGNDTEYCVRQVHFHGHPGRSRSRSRATAQRRRFTGRGGRRQWLRLARVCGYGLVLVPPPVRTQTVPATYHRLPSSHASSSSPAAAAAARRDWVCWLHGVKPVRPGDGSLSTL